MDELENRLLNLPLKSPSDALDRKVLAAAGIRPASQLRTRRSSLFRSDWSLARAAVAVLVAAALVGAGWAGERIYRKVACLWVVLERSAVDEWELPDGNKMFSGEGMMVTSVDATDPKAVENARLHFDETKRLIGEKKYELVKTFDAAGEKQYVYRFTFADGTHSACNFSMPLDKVLSWDDYQQKAKIQRRQRLEQINKAIAAGKFRLLDADVRCVHVCRDAATNRKLRVQRLSGAPHVCVTVPANKQPQVQRAAADVALISSFDDENQASTMPQTSWQEHLDAIRKGNRVLLNLEKSAFYTYEMTLDDGTTTIFNYGGGEPLKKPETAKSEKK